MGIQTILGAPNIRMQKLHIQKSEKVQTVQKIAQRSRIRLKISIRHQVYDVLTTVRKKGNVHIV